MSRQLQRRQFLRLVGGTLAAVGVDQLNLWHQARQCDRVLAQSTQRKLALLVGINAYPDAVPSLRGCLTDVEMQYELLVHRYGFNRRDILVVSDSTLFLPGQTVVTPPTRQNILEAFETHLIGQAKPDDVVIFHYSGHGSFVQEDNGVPEFNGLNGTIVPYDGRSQPGNRVDDIMGKTLFLLSLALPTEYVTVVLDSCYAGGGIRGNAVIRALDNPHAQPSEQELDYQAQWMSRLNLDPTTLQEQRRRGIAKGVALGSAQVNQLASEVPFEGFHAGAFTYLLTQYLWQLPNQQPLSDTFVNLARSTRDVANQSGVPQDPIYAVAPERDFASNPIYLSNPVRSSAEAVVRSVEGDAVSFWLGGLSANNLSTQQAVFSLIDNSGMAVGEVIQTSRSGLIGQGLLQTATHPPQPGQLMREQVREIPTHLKLRVGIASSLAEESAVALTVLDEISRVEGLVITSAEPVDYLLGRFTQTAQAQARQRGIQIASPLDSVGLLTPDLTPIQATFGAATGESVQGAIGRLRSRLKMLLAGKILGTLTNSDASSLEVAITLWDASQSTALLSVGSYSAQVTGQSTSALARSVQVPAGNELQIQVQNYESRDLFISLLSIASTGEMAILHPVAWDSPEDASRIGAQATLQVPNPSGRDRFQLIAEGPAGFLELMVLASTEPLRQALRGLQAIARGRRSRAGNPLQFTEGARANTESEDAPVEVVDALLDDLDRGARGGLGIVSHRNTRRIDAQHLAAFSLVVEVVD